jgi:cytochrome P450
VRPETDTDFTTAAALADPYSIYDALRPHGRAVWNTRMNGWNLYGFDENSEVLSDSGSRFAIHSSDMACWFEAPNMILLDGAEHHRLRNAISPYFTRRQMAKWEQRVREVVDDLVAPLVQGSQSYDLIEDFTMIPTIIVADLLGVPPVHYRDFRRWSHEILSNLSWGSEPEEARIVIRRASAEINEYMKMEIERHRRNQPDDLITSMLNQPEPYAMTDDEIRSTAVLLMVAGYDTTAKTLGNVLLALEQNPDQRRDVVEHLDLVPVAIEEAMRWCGPIQYMSPRQVVSDIDFGGVKLTTGESLFVFPAAANRDPKRWDRPNVFDVHRAAKSHLGFGWGPHLCLGAPLARLETRVAIERLLKAAPQYSLTDIDLGAAFFMRGPERGVITPAGQVGAR